MDRSPRGPRRVTLVEAAILGTVQALTEFLPVSSSGHLRLGAAWLNVDGGHDLLFDIVLHLGTLGAVLGIYRARIVSLVADLASNLGAMRQGLRGWLEASEGARMLALTVIATLPTGLIGVALSDPLEGDAVGPRVVGALLVLNGAVLWYSKRFGEDREVPERPLSIGGIGPREAFLIGIAQGVAVLPGISRAGMTIVCALALGARRLKAAEFSFLLSIPAILGASVLSFDVAAIRASDAAAATYALGALVSALVGVAALLFLLRLLRDAHFHRFALYCWLLGAAAIAIG